MQKDPVMATQHGTVVGVFNDHDDARRAIRALKDAGFTEDQIGVASSNREGLRATDGDDAGDESYAGEGAAAGLATGAGLGALWGLGILAGALPAIGPAIAGGTLAALLSSAAVGAAAAGLAGTLIGMGIPKDEAEFYESEMQAGRTIVTVHAGTRRDEAMAIMRRFSGYDMSNRPATTTTGARSTHAEPARSALAGDACATGIEKGQHAKTGTSGNTIRAHEEQLHAEKKSVQAGEAVVRKEVHTEHKTVDVPVTREELVVERRPGSGQVSSGEIREGQEIRVPIKEEQVNLEKQTVVAEEVNIGKRKVQDTERVGGTVRKEEIKVDTKGDVNVRDKR
jgi:uncharacterized protein (TIGR02271 family)